MTTTQKTAAASGPTTVRRRREHRRTHTTLFALAALVLWGFLGVVTLHLLHNEQLLPVWIFVGAAAVPVTLMWVMAHRLRVTDTVSWSQLAIAAIFGGLLSISVGGTLDALSDLIPQPHLDGGPGVVTLLGAGVIEEFSKGVFIVVFGWRVAKTARNGLFIGGAVGIGFAVFETMGYILSHYQGTDPVWSSVFVTLLRGVTSPFGHVLWSALLGAALFAAASRTGRFRVTWLVLATYIGVAVLHGAWDGTGPLVHALTGDKLLSDVAETLASPILLVGGGLIWLRVARRVPAPAGDETPSAPDAETPAVPAA